MAVAQGSFGCSVGMSKKKETYDRAQIYSGSLYTEQKKRSNIVESRSEKDACDAISPEKIGVSICRKAL